MQDDPKTSSPIRPRPTPTHLVGVDDKDKEQQRTVMMPQRRVVTRSARRNDITTQPTLAMKFSWERTTTPVPAHFEREPVTGAIDDVSNQSTTSLMQLSGMMRPIKLPPEDSNGASPSNTQFYSTDRTADQEEGYWPNGIQQTGALPIKNLYGREPFGRILPAAPVSSEGIPETSPARPAGTWKHAMSSPAVKITLGLLIGIALLFLVAQFVDLPATVATLRQSLTTLRGIGLALLAGTAFLLAFSIRGVRWKLFLNPVGKVSTLKAIQLFLVGIFLNFLLPIRGGEVAKSLMLKRIANIPVSKSLPTVAMDKALDLMPALFIMAIVPFLGVKMDIKLWIVLALVAGLLVGLVFFIALAAWKRDAAIQLLQKMTHLLPKSISDKIEGFATGFVDSLLMAASQPRIFIPAILLTAVAVTFDGLFAMLAFWTVGYQISFGTAIFGYTVYNMFYILPTPPGQVGSNEAIGLLVFAGLLHLPADKVTAMFVFSHPWSALLMTLAAMICLSALGLKLSTAMKVQTESQALGV